jgi:hypothetical protein
MFQQDKPHIYGYEKALALKKNIRRLTKALLSASLFYIYLQEPVQNILRDLRGSDEIVYHHLIIYGQDVLGSRIEVSLKDHTKSIPSQKEKDELDKMTEEIEKVCQSPQNHTVESNRSIIIETGIPWNGCIDRLRKVLPLQ